MIAAGCPGLPLPTRTARATRPGKSGAAACAFAIGRVANACSWEFPSLRTSTLRRLAKFGNCHSSSPVAAESDTAEAIAAYTSARMRFFIQLLDDLSFVWPDTEISNQGPPAIAP